MDVILKNNFFFDKETKVLESKLTTDFVVACKSYGVWITYGIVCLSNRLLRVLYVDIAEFEEEFEDEYYLNVWLKKFPDNTWGLNDDKQAIAIVFAEYPIPY